MTNFNQISQANFRAFSLSTRTQDLINKKQEIFDSLNDFYNTKPKKILCIGFSSFIFINHGAELHISHVDEHMQNFARDNGVKFTYQADFDNIKEKFDVVIAADEFFTYADSDENQKNLVRKICSLATLYVITTLRDYKNQEYKDRECSLPMLIKNSKSLSLFVEIHEWNNLDRNAYVSNLFEIENNSKLINYGSFNRRVMYFKQLAKFSMDSGASQFLVHKNLMYKSLFKKNYEHVITIKF